MEQVVAAVGAVAVVAGDSRNGRTHSRCQSRSGQCSRGSWKGMSPVVEPEKAKHVRKNILCNVCSRKRTHIHGYLASET